MTTILNVTSPFFGLILCGYIAARKQWLPEGAVGGLNVFVLYFALPCMLFRFTSGTPFREILNLPVFFSYAVTGLVMTALVAYLAMVLFGDRLRDAAFAAMAASWSNSGYLGLPLFLALIGDKAVAPTVLTIMADLVIVLSAVLALAAFDGAGEKGLFGAVKDAFANVLKNPLIWSVFTGATVSGFEVALPVPVDNFFKLLGAAAGPCALFTIGASLVRPGTKVWDAETFTLTAGKLILHPLMAYLVAAYVFGLAPLELLVVVLSAALPAAGNIFVFAESYGANSGRNSAVILVSTAAAFITFSGLLYMLDVKPQ